MSECDPPASYEVTCCCGKTTLLRWNGQKWQADDPAWVYEASDPINATVDPFWSCGAAVHWQRKVRDLHRGRGGEAMSDTTEEAAIRAELAGIEKLRCDLSKQESALNARLWQIPEYRRKWFASFGRVPPEEEALSP